MKNTLCISGCAYLFIFGYNYLNNFFESVNYYHHDILIKNILDKIFQNDSHLQCVSNTLNIYNTLFACYCVSNARS